MNPDCAQRLKWERTKGKIKEMGVFNGDVGRIKKLIWRMNQNRSEPEKILLSIKESGKLVGVSEQAMRNLSYELGIQVRIGRRVLVYKKRLETWIEQQLKQQR